MCGEQHVRVATAMYQLGSSPRVRGAVKLCADLTKTIGIIPACAGSRLYRNQGLYDRRDHPRVCGEQLSNCGPYMIIRGSSPRVRGAVH